MIPLLLAIGIAAVLTPLAGRAASLVGLVDRPVPGPLKIHARAVPLAGGIAVTLAWLLATGADGWPRWPQLAGVAAALALGLLDDLRPLPAWPRVALLAAIGGVLVAGGVYLGPKGAWAAAGTVLVVVASANAVNIVDGQDGLAGGLAAISALALAALSAWAGAPRSAILGLALAGALAGFLLWNRPPARVFLGNGGAYAVGTLLAIMAAEVTAHDGWRGLLTAGMSLGVFVFELTFSAAHRIRAGYLVGGDRSHSYDLVSRRLGDRWHATLIFWGLGVASAALALVIGRVPLPVGVSLTTLAAAAAGAWGFALWRRASEGETPGGPKGGGMERLRRRRGR